MRVNTACVKNKRVIIVDDFYHDPHAVRQFALEQEFFEGPEYIGKRTKQQFLIPGIREAFGEIIGEPVIRWEEYGMNGRFQYNVAGEPLVYHSDGQRWAGMIYLTPDAPAWSGTNSYRHKATGFHHKAQASNITEIYDQNTFLDPTPYEQVDAYGNIFNRLVLFDGGLIHAAGGYFGYEKTNARLWHMFFFDT